MKTNQKSRLLKIKEAPISWKERDLLTAAEKYMAGLIDVPFVEMSLPCFPEMEKNIVKRIEQVWHCGTAAFHLQKIVEHKLTGGGNSHFGLETAIEPKAARIYEQEAQRILGSVFPMENKFWKAFYIRQQSEETKPLVAIDALHFSTGCQAQIAHQLLGQSLKAILTGYYAVNGSQKTHFENARRLLVDLPTPHLLDWLNDQMIN